MIKPELLEDHLWVVFKRERENKPSRISIRC